MRPVTRGADPGGYAEYSLAYPLLVRRIGRYCSFCEARLKNGHVEHVLPKDPSAYPHLSKDWDNFLLACGNCNPTKGVWPKPGDGGRAAAYWPDTDNTAYAYEYRPRLPPGPAPALTAAERGLAEALLRRTGVDRSPLHPSWSPKDDRWELRMEAWEKAINVRVELQGEDTPTHRKRIAELATATGFWSVWFTVFKDDIDMLTRLNAGFNGTAGECFDPVTMEPVRGQRGRL